MSCAPAQLNVFQSWCGNFLSEVNSLNTVLPNLYDGYRFTWSGSFLFLRKTHIAGRVEGPYGYGVPRGMEGG